ncbi:stage V sporulation protein D (sporulation-specific penicillin-binding protein) [Natranaerovirga hydrolytica]|uniref:Stage V sporulation protein D (Sporulation-specific penicillin-binding protein) n=1 Tax=Natranaerovirga hydrolytica TaxID=680378 RepID=A0A4R1MZ81_9FIRM|nr:penicillin-binding transpeptidase domain-containing protein [Natranaerovirga hydrolytica]TCK97862.1 stage V sporulation protein D (sporulation-specific penicillin-binding protein) [Natranaerovirga hydrolytica]
MERLKTFNRKKLVVMHMILVILTIFLMTRLSYLMIFQSEFLQGKAEDLQSRERSIKARRGYIYDRNGDVIAVNKPVNTISVIHNQIKDPENVSRILAQELELDYEYVRQKVDNRVALERIKTNVEREVADRIREYDLEGVAIDEDYRRWYPFNNLASHIIGFTGSDNQGIIGLEIMYEDYLKGMPGKILTRTDARGVEIENMAESRIEPVDGNHLVTTIDINIQKYAEQALEKVLKGKEANRGSLIVMNPQNGEILAMVNKPDFDLNEPFELYYDPGTITSEEEQNLLNQMWRNYSINDTYEPGSTFKIITAAAALEEGVVSVEDTFFCPGHKIVEDRVIRCHKAGGHGSQTFLEGVMNSCNPVFMEIVARMGVETFYSYYETFGLFEKTGVDLPGEAVAIMHKIDNIGPVELATMSFGQSFQITPLQLITAASAVVNGGDLVTPHIGTEIIDYEGNVIKTFQYTKKENAISSETSEVMKGLLEKVVSDGTGHRSYIPGYKVGGKTATSEKLPRSSNKYISSFIGFAPSDNPQVIALVLVDEPVGIYYGGTVGAPVIKELFENILPYMEIEPQYSELDFSEYDIGKVEVPNLINKSIEEIKAELRAYEFELEVLGNGEMAVEQFPLPGQYINKDSKVIVYAE